jgi:uncharacterized protein (TIGR00251 family)
MIALEQTAAGVVIPVRVRAGARWTGVAGEHDGALRVDVTAAPEKGKANKAVVAVLGELLGVAKRDLAILSGETSPQKRILASGTNADAVHRLLASCLARLSRSSEES